MQMPALNNHRRELFAQLLFQGFSAVDAYAKSGYKRHDGNACTLAKNPEVQARLEEIRGERAAASGLPFATNAIAARAKVTAESLVEMAHRTYDGAMEGKQYGAANGSIREMGVLAGVRVERKEIGQPGEFDHLTDDELLAQIRERLAKLGWLANPTDLTQPDAESDTTRY
jgi:phage terminase small subunit